MTERYHGGYTPAGRAATFSNPARSSMPSSIGYTSLYAGDMHVLPASSTSTRHPVTTPRGYSVSTSSSGVPTTTRTYSVTQDPARRSSVVQDHSRNRRSTVDSTSRPPVIVTTTQKDRQPTTSTHRIPSPVRHSHRASEGQFFTQPATSSRVRPNPPIYSPSYETDDYSRSRDRTETLTARDAEAYRNARPSVVYPSDPRHTTAAPIDYGDEGYQYTNAGELARYDLDHSRPARRQRESIDRGYYRPNISYNTDQRSLNVNASADLSRNYSMNTSRPYEGSGRGGPPPSTRGFAQVNRSFDSNGNVPPSAPVPPSPTVATRLEPASSSSEWREGRRSRPVSLYQDVVPHSSHHDEYYRSREDERNVREQRERERERDSKQSWDLTHFHDDSVQSRGFGIRTGPIEPEHDGRRDRELVRREEHRKRSDEDLPPRGSRESDLDREGRHRDDNKDDRRDDRRGDRDGRRGSDEDKGRDRSRIRDKLSSGMGIAAAAVGLKPILKDDKSDPEPRRRRSPSEVAERLASIEASEKARASEKDRSADHQKEKRDSPESRDTAEARSRNRKEAEARLNGEAVVSGSDSDGGQKRITGGRRTSSIFNPNDAGDISKLREQLAGLKTDDKEKESERERPVVIETRQNRSRSQTRSRSASEPRDSQSKLRSDDEARGRMVVSPPESEQKMVRVVSPPREKSDEKPLKGILKQPKSKFPEPDNFIREGAAPHKEDKKAKEVPQGARWTKISRKVVNPEALTIGKERFEIRDDFVIVLRVLDKEEIQAYAAATQVLRERRRPRNAGEDDDKKDEDRERDDEGRRRRRHRQHREKDDDDSDYDREKDSDRRRRNRRDDDEEAHDRRSTRELDSYHHRAHRERERERAAEA